MLKANEDVIEKGFLLLATWSWTGRAFSTYHVVVLFHRIEFRPNTCSVFESIRFDAKESKRNKREMADSLCVFKSLSNVFKGGLMRFVIVEIFTLLNQ